MPALFRAQSTLSLMPRSYCQMAVIGGSFVWISLTNVESPRNITVCVPVLVADAVVCALASGLSVWVMVCASVLGVASICGTVEAINFGVVVDESRREASESWTGVEEPENVSRVEYSIYSNSSPKLQSPASDVS